MDPELIDHEQCHKCGYSLRSLSRKGLCPECGTPVIDSLRSNDERALFKREIRILFRMNNYRRNRSNSIGLAFLSGLSGIMTSLLPSQNANFQVSSNIILVGMFGIVFWSTIAFANHARLRHAQSIEYHHREMAKRAATTLGVVASDQFD